MNKLIIAILLFSKLVYASDPYPRNPAIDIRHYKFKLEVNDTTNIIAGQAKISIAFIKSVSQFSLDLVSQDENGKGMKVTSITSEENNISFIHKENRLTMQLNSIPEAGTTLSFTINYSGIPLDGLIIGTNKFNDRTYFGDNWPDRARHWLPTIDHPSDKAGCEFIVIAPNHYQVIANGIKVEQSNLDKNRMLTHWREEIPIPTKVMVIGMARFAVKNSGFVNHIPVETWVYPQNKEKGFHDFKIAISILEYFQQHIGTYPYQKLANVQSTTRYGGMENAGNIFYFENSVTGNNEIEKLIAHEIAHQWFGDSASENDWYHVWLSEGFATYFTNLYLENKYGRDKLEKQMKEQRDKVIAYYQKTPAPVIDTTITDINEVLNTNTYQKGGWFLHMLRYKIGDEAFWKGIRLYYDTYKNSNAMTNDLRIIMEQVSGKSLEVFFKQWLEVTGHPKLSFKWAYNSKTGTIEVVINQTQTPLFETTIDIGIEDDLGHTEIVQMDLNSIRNIMSIKKPKKPRNVVFDPNTRLLFEPAK